MVRVFRKIRQYAPAASLAFVALALIAGVLHISFIYNADFADFFNIHISGFFRRLTASLTGWFPFSLAESCILASPVILAAVYGICLKKSRRGRRYFIRCVVGLLSVLLLVYFLFVLLFAAGYRGNSLDVKLGLERRDVSADELYATMTIVRDKLNELADEVIFVEDVGSVRPYLHEDTVKLCLESYDKLSEEFDFLNRFESSVKPLALSKYMTYTHISGVYTFFTGEANLNTNYPYFVNVFTTAHEMAHQRGIARENEANFIAYLVCILSDDPYMQYSGYLNMYEYLASPLYKASPSYYRKATAELDSRVRYDLDCYGRFFDQYRDSVASDVSDAVNNTYLVLQGTEGSKSYGMVVDLAVAYHLGEERDGETGN